MSHKKLSYNYFIQVYLLLFLPHFSGYFLKKNRRTFSKNREKFKGGIVKKHLKEGKWWKFFHKDNFDIRINIYV